MTHAIHLMCNSFDIFCLDRIIILVGLCDIDPSLNCIYQLRRHRLIGAWIPIVNLRWSSDRLRFIMEIHLTRNVRRHLFSEQRTSIASPAIKQFYAFNPVSLKYLWSIMIERLQLNHIKPGQNVNRVFGTRCIITEPSNERHGCDYFIISMMWIFHNLNCVSNHR